MKIDLKTLGRIAKAVAPIILPIIPDVREAVRRAKHEQGSKPLRPRR